MQLPKMHENISISSYVIFHLPSNAKPPKMKFKKYTKEVSFINRRERVSFLNWSSLDAGDIWFFSFWGINIFSINF